MRKKINWDRLERKYLKNNLPLLANDIIDDIQERTRKGFDRNNRTFEKYTVSYAREKVEKYGSSRPNLTRTGKMLNSITWKKINNGIRIYFNSDQQLKKARGNQKKRKFFGLDPLQRKRIRKDLKKYR